MAGKGVRVLVTPTSDLGKILACMHGQYFHTFFFPFSIYCVVALDCYLDHALLVNQTS